jgi:hypothetical protein
MRNLPRRRKEREEKRSRGDISAREHHDENLTPRNGMKRNAPPSTMKRRMRSRGLAIFYRAIGAKIRRMRSRKRRIAMIPRRILESQRSGEESMRVVEEPIESVDVPNIYAVFISI